MATFPVHLAPCATLFCVWYPRLCAVGLVCVRFAWRVGDAMHLGWERAWSPVAWRVQFIPHMSSSKERCKPKRTNMEPIRSQASRAVFSAEAN